MKSCRNFSQQTTRATPLDPNLMFRCISYYLGAFGTVCCVITLSSKQAKLVQKFVPRSCVGIFRSEHTRLSPLGPKLIFWCVRTIWLHLVPFGCLTKLGAKRPKWCKSLSHEIVSEFFATNVPIHPIEPKTHVS